MTGTTNRYARPATDVLPQTTVVADATFTYRRRGTGEPLVYVRGQGHADLWLPLHERLADTFDVISPDPPGFGGTELPDSILDFNDLAVRYAELLDQLTTEPTHLVGHGFGGWLAAEFAAIYPERLRSLTLIAPSGLRPDDDEPILDWYRLDRDRFLDVLLSEDRASFDPLVERDGDAGEAFLADYQERVGIARVAWNPRFSLRLEHRLHRIDVPTQVLVPDSDRLIGPSVARRYVELIQGAKLTVVSGVDEPTQHLVVLQEPDRIAELVGEIASSSRVETQTR